MWEMIVFGLDSFVDECTFGSHDRLICYRNVAQREGVGKFIKPSFA